MNNRKLSNPVAQRAPNNSEILQNWLGDTTLFAKSNGDFMYCTCYIISPSLGRDATCLSWVKFTETLSTWYHVGSIEYASI